MANNRRSYESSMRIRAILFIVVFLLMVAVILSLLDGMGISIGGKKEEAEPSPTPAAQQIFETLPDLVETTPAPVESAPVHTPAPTPEPTPTPTPTPEPTPEPTPVPETWGEELGRGRIISNTGTGLNIAAEWVAVSQPEAKVDFVITVYLQSYGITTISQPVTVTVGTESTTVYGAVVNYEGNAGLDESELATVTLTTDLAAGSAGLFPISASWQFNGSYSGKEFTSITCEETVTVER